MASRQHRQTIEIPAGRGTIYDRTGEPLAIGEQATTVYADPADVVARRRSRSRPRSALGLTPTSSIRRCATARSSSSTSTQGRALKAGGLERQRSRASASTRRSGGRTRKARVASNLLGFAGTDNFGLDGLEQSLDRTLAGRPGYEIVVRDPAGRRSTS